MIDDAAGLESLKRKIEAETGFNAALYKDKCLQRRIEVRVRVRGCDGFGEYGDLLDREPEEYQRLMDTLTINVTKFFRDRAAWEVIRQEVVPHLCGDSTAPARIWSAGCASGEEVYSLAILLREHAEEGGGVAQGRFEILGTDIDRRSLEAAQRGVYPALSFEEMPEETRRRWFHPGTPSRIRDELREGVTFRRADLISDPAPEDLSLILCRNVIIYLERAVQEQLFERFHHALRPGGYLVLGRVETLLGPTRSLFRPVAMRERVYMRL